MAPECASTTPAAVSTLRDLSCVSSATRWRRRAYPPGDLAFPYPEAGELRPLAGRAPGRSSIVPWVSRWHAGPWAPGSFRVRIRTEPPA